MSRANQHLFRECATTVELGNTLKSEVSSDCIVSTVLLYSSSIGFFQKNYENTEKGFVEKQLSNLEGLSQCFCKSLSQWISLQKGASGQTLLLLSVPLVTTKMNRIHTFPFIKAKISKLNYSKIMTTFSRVLHSQFIQFDSLFSRQVSDYTFFLEKCLWWQTLITLVSLKTPGKPSLVCMLRTTQSQQRHQWFLLFLPTLSANHWSNQHSPHIPQLFNLPPLRQLWQLRVSEPFVSKMALPT